ncbi:MAG: N-acetylneuraminate synthase family protein [Magnetococcales bacterium]|nr:N-acetylneuraminate synthase family protein [Magnetococcales bacterium]
MRYDSQFPIGSRTLSLTAPTYFIADIAANHDGDLDRARQLIRLAKEAGADAAKFQHFLAKDIVSDVGFNTLGSQKSHQASWKKSVFEIYDQYHCRREWTDVLIEECAKVGIDFMTSPYDFEAIDTFADLVPAIKIGSGDITWLQAVERIAKKGKPVLLACGASTMDEIERAVETILQHNRQIVLMQCNTNYTAHTSIFAHVNLNVLRSFAIRWPGMILGLSDHTHGHATVLGAIALGARVIEKHFTDDNARIGPDHHFAMNPTTWKEMVLRSRELEMALGSGHKSIEENEKDTVVIQRRALRFRSDLVAGQCLTEEHLEALRPCPPDGLPPYRLTEVVGRTLARNVQQGVHLTWQDLI